MKHFEPTVDIMGFNSNVTGSMSLCVVRFPDNKSVKFLVDCGLFQEKGDTDELNREILFNAETVSFALCTHVHIDHVGRFPLLVKKGFNGPIYASEDTCKLAPLALADSFNVMEQDAKRKKKALLYAEKDIDKMVSLLKAVEFGKTTTVYEEGDKKIDVTFFMNGHLIGAAIILVQIKCTGYEDINLKFTGDYNSKNEFFDVEPMPNWVYELPITVVQESTYGTTETCEIKKVFRDNISEHLKKRGTVIVPVFSLGRSQEILKILKEMQEEGTIDSEIPIYLDGKLAIKYTHCFAGGGLRVPYQNQDFLPENFKMIGKNERAALCRNNECKVILTTSGMGSYGPAQVYIPEFITRKNTLIHFTGYCADGTLGRKLKDTEDGAEVEISGKTYVKRARVEYTSEFSGHAKSDQMIEFLKRFKHLKLVLLNHGEVETKVAFRQVIEKEVEAKNVEILGRDTLYRINPYGLVKTINTKF